VAAIAVWAPFKDDKVSVGLARPFIERACARGSEIAAEMVLRYCGDQNRTDWTLWLVARDGQIIGAGATQMQEWPEEPKRLVLVVGAGRGLSVVQDVVREMELVARHNTARVLRIEGRRGWARVLGFEVIGRNAVGGWVMERRL
jgi:hypothetical protein